MADQKRMRVEPPAPSSSVCDSSSTTTGTGSTTTSSCSNSASTSAASRRPAVRIPRKLVQAIRDGDCVAFVGAGFSVPARLPGWGRLLEFLVDELCGTTDDGDPHNGEKRRSLRRLLGYDAAGKWVGGANSDTYDQCAQVVEDELGEQRVCDLLSEAMRLPARMPAAMEERRDLLMSIPFRAILTTNFDDILPGIAAELPEAKRVMRAILRDPPRHFQRMLKTSAVGIDNAGSDDTSSLSSPSASTPGPGRSVAQPFQAGRRDPRNWGPTLRLHGAVNNNDLSSSTRATRSSSSSSGGGGGGGAGGGDSGDGGEFKGGPILSRKGYRRLLHGNAAYRSFLSAVMASKTVLYVYPALVLCRYVGVSKQLLLLVSVWTVRSRCRRRVLHCFACLAADRAFAGQR